MRTASGHDYRNSSVVVDLAMGQIPRSMERIYSYLIKTFYLPTLAIDAKCDKNLPVYRMSAM